MPDLTRLVERLAVHYGEPQRPPAMGPFELVLWENAGYLIPDERRVEVFSEMRTRVGLTPRAILDAKDEVLMAIAKMGGMHPDTRVLRWREIAHIVVSQFDGDLDGILRQPYAAAKKALKLFPAIGDPGAEKILMMCGMARGLPLESNGLRTLMRIGYGILQKSYSANYRSVQEAIAGEIPPDSLRAHLLLRQHGKSLCRDNAPLCKQCPVSDECNWFRAHGSL